MSLSTHVLDTARGTARGGRGGRAAHGDGELARDDGDRRRRPRARSARSARASYELEFAVGDYFGERAFLDRIPVRFTIADAGGALPRAAARLALGVQHLPRQLTPFTAR